MDNIKELKIDSTLWATPLKLVNLLDFEPEKVKELKIDSTLWATPSKLVNLLDFKPNKLNIQTKSNTKNDIKVHHVKYEDVGFYLVIDNLEGYFNFSNNFGRLNMLLANIDQQNKYYQVWKEILKIINGGHGELNSSKEIRLFAIDDLPIRYVFKIHSMSIVIRSLIEGDNKFYPKILLNHCSCEI